VGGVHGDEPEGTRLVEDFINLVGDEESQFKFCFVCVPRYNPDGLDTNSRTNGNGVDLNRNFPASDWSPEVKAPRYHPGDRPGSEPETQSLVKLIELEKPFLIIHCHSWKPQICYTGQASRFWAEMMGKDFGGHPVTEDIGYPTPGSLGQYCLLNLKTPCLCIELPEQIQPSEAWSISRPGLTEIARSGPT
jgi:hypothetical protein